MIRRGFNAVEDFRLLGIPKGFAASQFPESFYPTFGSFSTHALLLQVNATFLMNETGNGTHEPQSSFRSSMYKEQMK